MSTDEVLISVVTATYNSVGRLPGLIASLRVQSDAAFEWIVADGGSTDGTIELASSVSGLRVSVLSQSDFGVYDALNRGIRHASGRYYVIAGDDDRFNADAIANYRRAIQEFGADIIVAKARCGTRCFRVKRGPLWIIGEKAFIGSHSVAVAFNRQLHARFGYYSRRFPLAADSLFVQQVCRAGIDRREVDFIAGEIGGAGVSSSDWVGSATELFRVQLACGHSMIPQLFLLVLRLIKGRSEAIKAVHNAVFR